MKKIFFLLAILTCVLIGACAPPPPGEIGRPKAGFELRIIEDIKELKVFERMEFRPLQASSGIKIPPALLRELNGSIEGKLREISRRKGSVGQTVVVTGQITEFVGIGAHEHITAVVRLHDSHNWMPLGAVEIIGRGRGQKAARESQASIVLGIQELIERYLLR